MMQKDKILISGIVGTTAMTLFSYLISEWKNKNYREPQILGQLIQRTPLVRSYEPGQVVGWSAHYAIGIIFVAVYDQLWDRTSLKPSLTSGTMLGLVSGVVGVIGWKIMFGIHPNPPRKHLKPYLGHLILAHIVFGVFSAFTHKSTAKR